MDLEQLELDIITTMNKLEDKAFELYVKDQIEERIKRTEVAEENLAKLHSIKAEQTIEYFKKNFNSYSPKYTGTSRDYYMDKIKNKV